MSIERVKEGRRRSLTKRRALAAIPIFLVYFLVMIGLMGILVNEIRRGNPVDFSDRVVSFVVFAPGSLFLLFDYAKLLGESAVMFAVLVFNSLFWSWIGGRWFVRD